MYTIKTSKDVEEEILLEKINNNKIREIKIKELISDNKEDLNIDKKLNANKINNNNNNFTSIKLPLPQIQADKDRPIDIKERYARLFNKVQ